jgi:hypothetical protein
MIVDNLNVFSAGIIPDKANPKLVINPDAVLPLSIAFQLFQHIPWWDTQVIKADGNLELPELAPGDSLDCHKARYPDARCQ